MTTLYQLHTDLDRLKAHCHELVELYQAGDGVILLGQSCAYVDWLLAILADIGSDSHSNCQPQLYALHSDVDALSTATRSQLLPHQHLTLISDDDWVGLTLAADKVVTLS